MNSSQTIPRHRNEKPGQVEGVEVQNSLDAKTKSGKRIAAEVRPHG